MKPEPFVIKVHHQERVIEVHYPEHPTMEAYEKYETEIRAAILQLASAGHWYCIVDQRALQALGPDFPPRIALLNAWARENGMRRTARVVSDSYIGELQTKRILRDGGVANSAQVFRDRELAWEFITTKDITSNDET